MSHTSRPSVPEVYALHLCSSAATGQRYSNCTEATLNNPLSLDIKTSGQMTPDVAMMIALRNLRSAHMIQLVDDRTAQPGIAKGRRPN